jgi:phosphoglycolate phosphatase-like HAD superfamily hydrolase
MGLGTGRIAILFDVDTLIDDGGAATVSWRRAFEELFGMATDVGELPESGISDPDLARLLFRDVTGRDPSTRELAQLLSRRLDYLPEAVTEAEGYEVKQGVPDLLVRLGRDGYLVGVAAGAVESAVHIELGRAGLGRHFTFGGYGSDSADRIELTRIALERAGIVVGRQLNQSEALVVGDDPDDMEAARGAGAVPVGVASGPFSADQLREAGAEFVLGSLRDPLPL